MYYILSFDGDGAVGRIGIEADNSFVDDVNANGTVDCDCGGGCR